LGYLTNVYKSPASTRPLSPVALLYAYLCSRMSPFLFFFLMLPPPPRSTLFPYTTLFRSCRCTRSYLAVHHARVRNAAQEGMGIRSEEHTSELQSLRHLVCRLLLEKKKKKIWRTRIERITRHVVIARSVLTTASENSRLWC